MIPSIDQPKDQDRTKSWWSPPFGSTEGLPFGSTGDNHRGERERGLEESTTNGGKVDHVLIMYDKLGSGRPSPSFRLHRNVQYTWYTLSLVSSLSLEVVPDSQDAASASLPLKNNDGATVEGCIEYGIN